MRLKKLISGIAALAVSASAFAGLAVTAGAAAGDKTEIYSGTPTWTALGGNAEAVTNHYGLDTSASAEAAAHTQGGGSGGRSAYTYFTDVTPTNEQNVEVEFYLNIRGSNTSGSDFYLMSKEQKVTNSVPGSGVILDIAYSKYLETVTVNGTEITNLPKNNAAAYQPGSGSPYASTGLIKYDVLLNYNAKQAEVTVYGNTTETYTVSFADSTVTGFKGFFSLLGRAQAGCAIYDVNVSTVETEAQTYYNVEFDVEGEKTSQMILAGSTVNSVPDTVKEGYVFKGWSKDGDTETLYTAAEIAELAIVSDTSFTAVFEADSAYIEPIAAVEFKDFPEGGKLVAGADENTAESNRISVKVTGNLGTDLMENPDSRIDAPVVTYELKGFRWLASKMEATGDVLDTIYCDSYGELIVADNAADFQIKKHPFNYYGQIIATVVYNGETKTISKPLVYIGDDNADVNQILPRGGYVSDVNAYSPDMVGYTAATSGDNRSASDIVTDNWAGYGSASKTVSIAEDENGRFINLTANNTGGSAFAANRISAVTDTQVVFDQMVRFHNANETILLKTDNPVTWAENSTSFSVTFNGSKLSINGADICDAATNTWYNIIVNSDVSAKKCYAVVKNAEGAVLGTSDVANFINAGSTNPTYYMFRCPDRTAASLDFNDVKIYRASIDASSMTTTDTGTTISIPEEGTASTTITVDAKTTEGYKAIGAAVWSVEGEPRGITVEPSAEDSHVATVTVDSTAAAGTAAVNVSIGGITASVDLTVTSSKDSIKFATPIASSISIPLDDTNTEAEYSATVIDGNGETIEGKDVTIELYDANNTSRIRSMPAGISFADGKLVVTKEALAGVYTVRATSTNSDGETITNSVKITLHGLSFDFGAGTDEDVAEGYTSVAPTTSYNAARGYGISSGTVTAGGTASAEDANADYVTGNPFTFKANVQKGKWYTIEITYQGELTSGYVNSDMTGFTLGSQSELAKATYKNVPVPVDVLDLTVSGDGAKIASITITKEAERTAGAKPGIYHMGDSTAVNNGSWAYHIDHNRSSFPELEALATFYMRGGGGRNLHQLYNQGYLRSILRDVRPGDIVMIGNNGTNGTGSHFEENVNYCIDAAEAMGAKVILNSYTPHGAVGDYTGGYDAETNTFTGWRQDGYDNIVRKIAAEREESDENYLGFVEIGKNADAIFTAYAADYAANGYESADAAAQAIIACFSDHNHYSNAGLARDLMLDGYTSTLDGTHIEGIVEQIVAILSSEGPEPPAKEIEVKSFEEIASYPEAAAVGAEITNNSDDTVTVELIIAEHDADGKLVRVTLEAVEIAAGATEKISNSIYIMNSDWTTIKAYLWNAENNKPLADVLEAAERFIIAD